MAGFLVLYWKDIDWRESVEAGTTRQRNAIKGWAKDKRGVSEEDALMIQIEGCMAEKMFNRAMGWSEEFTPYEPDAPDSNGWEIKGSMKWINMLVPQKEMKYPERPICRVRLIRRDRLAIVGGWCFIRDVPKLSFGAPPARNGHKGGYLIDPKDLSSVEPFRGVAGEELHRMEYWSTMT